MCAGESQRYDRAIGLLSRALDIREAELGPHDVQAADSREVLDRCFREMEEERERRGGLMQCILSSILSSMCHMHVPVI